MFDLLLLNGRLLDGTGSPDYPADLAIERGRIAAIGRLKPRLGQRFATGTPPQKP